MIKTLPVHEMIRPGREIVGGCGRSAKKSLTEDKAGEATEQVHETRHQVLHDREDGLEG